MLTCSSVFIGLVILLVVFLVTASRKSNLCFLSSLFISSVITIVFYVLVSTNGRDAALDFANLFTDFPVLSSLLNREKISLVYGMWMIVVYTFSFIISMIVNNKIITIDSVFGKRSKDYTISKIILIIVNTILSAVIFIYAIADINILYGMDKGVLSIIFEFAEEGVLSL